jgi:hypothetical protein
LPNSFAYLALLTVVPLSALAFALLRPTLATALVLVFGVAFLPEQVAFDASGLPPLSKLTLTSLCVLVGALVTAPERLLKGRVAGGYAWLSVLALAGAVGTVFTNRDPLSFGSTALPALGPRDVISEMVDVTLSILVPFFIGRALYRTREDLADLYRVLVACAVVYVPLILIELRMSPQLHNWVYGFAQHSFAQTVRGSGYRPMVFMAHGIALAMLVFSALVAAIAVGKERRTLFGVPTPAWGVGLLLVLVLVKSVGAIAYAVAVVLLVAFARPRVQFVAALALGLVVALYPVTRHTGVFPSKTLVDWSAHVGQERAQSLAFRFENEDALLVRAQQRLTFGWGGFGRNRVWDDSGRDVSVTDGAWILVLGMNGVVGFIARFGLVLAPLWAAWRARRWLPREQHGALAVGALLVAFNAVDLLPNGLFSHLPLFFSGCLAGVAARARVRAASRAPQAARPAPALTRA